VKSRLVLPFWYRLTWVVPEKGPLNGCISLVDVEIIDPTEITKKALLACTLCRGGGLIITQNKNFVV